MTFPFQVRMGGIGSYEVIADAIGEGALKAHERKTTDVMGMPDVDLVVSESKRVLDVGGTTTFQIRLRNYGTKDATNLLVTANFSKNLKFANKAGGGSQDMQVAYNPAGKRREIRPDRQTRDRARKCCCGFWSKSSARTRSWRLAASR